MQTLAEGYFILPHTIADHLAKMSSDKIPTAHPAFKETEEEVKTAIKRLLSLKGDKTVDEYHKELGLIMWNYCGMSRNATGLKTALEKIKALESEFWENLNMVGTNDELNQTLEKAIRVADFFEMSPLMVEDALQRNESCGCHFREEYQTEDGEAKRDDENYAYCAAWEYKGKNQPEILHKEKLVFEEVTPTQRSYK
jgi:succinate dehydrogenase / fumarate reductase flavoprotein subunit